MSNKNSMKTLRNTITIGLLIFSVVAFAKTVTQKITVKGQCGECKEKIEKALDIPGVSFAEWNVDSKILTIRYNNSKISETDIHTLISNLGYATDKMEANKEAESKLNKCCQPKSPQKGKKSCCSPS